MTGLRGSVLGGVVVAWMLAAASPARVDPSAERGEASTWLRLDDGTRASVLLITVDTLRADHLGGAAGGESFTPHLDRLASTAVVFDAASTPATATRPAIASLLTGRYPGAHDVVHNQGRLRPDDRLLGEVFADAGYETVMFYGNDLLGRDSGFAQGFETAESFARLLGSADEAVASRAVAFLDDRPDDAPPFFLWLHFMDPHGPYFSAPPEARRRVPVDDGRPNEALAVADGNYPRGAIPKYQALRDRPGTATYRRRYRAEVHHTDAQIGRVLDALHRSGLADDTAILFTADHGESLGEHDLFFQHGWGVYEVSARVPLLVRGPAERTAPRRVPQAVSLVDLAPTLAAALEQVLPPETEGVDLAPLLRGESGAPVPVFTLSACPNQEVAVRAGDLKLIHRPERAPFGGWSFEPPGWWLFDVARDPAELVDLAVERPEDVERLRPLVERWEREHGIDGSRHRSVQEPDAALQRQLEALGYVQ